jgi:hypothetical protein
MHTEGSCKARQELDAVALGIVEKFDSALGYSQLITRETIESARTMGIPKPAPGIGPRQDTIARQSWSIQSRVSENELRIEVSVK